MKEELRKKAQESSAVIEQLYITMRHLFSRGFYKPMGVSGESLRSSLLMLSPEIYGSIGGEKTELNGLSYVIDRLPTGIEECRYINLTDDEGYSKSNFKAIIPSKRRRSCFRIDKDQMNIVVTRGRSDIYDILTHLTFLFMESHKIMERVVVNEEGKLMREWKLLEEIIIAQKKLSEKEREITIAHVGHILGRTFREVSEAHKTFVTRESPDRFFHIIYWLGNLAIKEAHLNEKREVTFSPLLRERIGYHIYGSIWAKKIKKVLFENDLIGKQIHIISANMHSVMNSIYAPDVLSNLDKKNNSNTLFELLSDSENEDLRKQVKEYAAKNGLLYVKDNSGTNINVQIIDTSKIDFSKTKYKLSEKSKGAVLIVMDYAFGEQAYECMEELLSPYSDEKNEEYLLDIKSISIMGKAGILKGKKGDIMIPNSHVFEGTADNYPFVNELKKEHFLNDNIDVYEGGMISVLGTSLQNRNILAYFHESNWKTIGIEMEGAHYQKAIQAASKIRAVINEDVKLRYAYYASDNPLETGSTLASGGLGTTGVRPTYLITSKILEQVF